MTTTEYDLGYENGYVRGYREGANESHLEIHQLKIKLSEERSVLRAEIKRLKARLRRRNG